MCDRSIAVVRPRARHEGSEAQSPGPHLPPGLQLPRRSRPGTTPPDRDSTQRRRRSSIPPEPNLDPRSDPNGGDLSRRGGRNSPPLAARKPRSQAVGQQAEGLMRLRAVPARNERAGRRLPLVGGMTREVAAASRMRRALLQRCLFPASFANVLVAGQPRREAELHSLARTGATPWRASLLSCPPRTTKPRPMAAPMSDGERWPTVGTLRRRTYRALSPQMPDQRLTNLGQGSRWITR